MAPASEGEVREIHLLPIGALPRGTVDALAAGLSRRIAVPCRSRAARAAPPVLLRGREQVDADALLASLDTDLIPGAVLVGVTALDMAIPIFTFVFGRATTPGWKAVVSLARLDPLFYGLGPSPATLLSRAEAEVLHELGHVAGLAHCRDAQCLMSFAGSVEKADARGTTFCAECARRVPSWLVSGHLDPTA
jgi:archaemetzincin